MCKVLESVYIVSLPILHHLSLFFADHTDARSMIGYIGMILSSVCQYICVAVHCGAQVRCSG